MSKIIVIEGPDRTGKQTQTKLLKKKLTKHGFCPIVIEVPIRSAVTYPLIYWMLRNGLAKKFPKIKGDSFGFDFDFGFDFGFLAGW